MNKLYRYEVGTEVKVNENAKLGMPSYVGRQGIIKEIITKGSFDYEVEFDKHTNGRFKEYELDLLFGEKKTVSTADSKVATNENYINLFFDHYKNDDDTYTVPKKLLLNLLEFIFE